jgi:hypothetical protein
MEPRGDYIGVGRGASNAAAEFSQQQLYETAAQMFGSMLDRRFRGRLRNWGSERWVGMEWRACETRREADG